MASLPPFYNIGTASVGAGSTAVTGIGTNWLLADGFGLKPGDQFRAAGLSVSIASVNSPTSITLASGWPGAARSNAEYEILRLPDTNRFLEAQSRFLVDLAANLSAFGELELEPNVGIHGTGSGALEKHPLTPYARTILAAANGGAARLALGANDAANLNAGILPTARLPFVAGTWTPSLGGNTTNPTATYTTQQGNYVKLGRYVYIHWRLDANVSAIGAGGLQILGVPFGASYIGSAISLGIQSLLNGPGASADINASAIRLLGLDGTVATTSILKTGTTGILIGAGMYATAA